MAPAAAIRLVPSERTRLELLLAAEKLFALHGLRGISLRQIVATTRQRNISTVHYHFGSREALVYAICDLRMPAIEAARAARIAAFIESPPRRAERVRELVDVLIQPTAQPIVESRGRSYFRRLLAHSFVSDVMDLSGYINGRYDLGIRQTAGLMRQELPHLSRATFNTRWALLIRSMTYLLANLEVRAALVSWRKGKAMLDDEMAAMATAFSGFLAAPDDLRKDARVHPRARATRNLAKR
jgi:AcrR family transcriptional regulator